MESMRTIENVAIEALVEAPENPNEMSDSQMASLVEFMRVEGYLQPLHIRPMEDGKYEIIDGHHRVRAAKELGLTTLPAVVEDIGPEKAMIRRIGLNKHRGELNLGLTGKHLKELNELGWDVDKLTITGFDATEISDLLKFSMPEDEAMPKAVALPEPEPDQVEKPQVLELEFRNAAEKRRAKKALKKAAGKNGTLADGLLRLLVEEEGDDDGD